MPAKFIPYKEKTTDTHQWFTTIVLYDSLKNIIFTNAGPYNTDPKINIIINITIDELTTKSITLNFNNSNCIIYSTPTCSVSDIYYAWNKFIIDYCERIDDKYYITKFEEYQTPSRYNKLYFTELQIIKKVYTFTTYDKHRNIILYQPICSGYALPIRKDNILRWWSTYNNISQIIDIDTTILKIDIYALYDSLCRAILNSMFTEYAVVDIDKEIIRLLYNPPSLFKDELRDVVD